MPAINSVASPYEVFFDANGAPLENGRIFIGAQGQNPETAPIAVYWDVDLTQPASQPIRTLNGVPSRNGSPGTVYVAESDYSITVRDRALRLVYTAPFQLTRLSAALVGYLPAGTGAVPTTVQAKLRETVSVKDFGAVGDGVTDDTAAIQAAVDSIVAIGGLNGAFGGSVYAPQGMYLSGNVVFPENMMIRFYGDGNGTSNGGLSATKFLKAATTSGPIFTLNTDGSALENITVQGLSGNTGDGVLVKASRCTVRNVSVFGMGNDGIRIGTDSGGENCNLWMLDNCKTKSNGRHGVYISEGAGALADANAGTCLHLDTQDNAVDGLRLNGTQLSTFVGGAYQSNGGNGITLTQHAEYNCFFGCDIEANTTAQVRIDAGAEYNAFYIYTMTYSMFSISATSENNRIECIDHNRVVSGIKFPPVQVSSTDPNTLDDYEEGLVTPTVYGATSAGVGTYTEQKGQYTKIGNRVEYAGNVTWTAHTGTGNIRIGLGSVPTPSYAGQIPRYIPVNTIGGPPPGAGKERVAFFDAGNTYIEFREFDQTTGAFGNSNALPASGTIYVSFSYITA
jgi:hypothetical protein